jgi:penicillin-binding protein 1B
LNRYPLAVESVVSAEAAYLTQWAMRRVVTQGTATWLNTRLPSGLAVAGKTGTTNDMRDSWFAGFSGDKVVVAWVGRDDNKPMGLSGSAGALRVWGDIVANLDTEPLQDLPPEGIVASGACGQSVPYIAGSGGSCGGGGAGAVARRADPSRKSAAPAAPVVAQEQPRAERPSRAQSEPKAERPKREQSPFLSDFYGN